MSNNKILYWIGNDIDKNNKNKQKLRNNFGFYGIKDYDNVINAMNDIKNLEFEFVFVIINCDLFENFVNIYTEEFAKTNKVIIASIIFCDNIYDHLNKKFINDQFYNPGGITDNIGGVINYINYAQNSYYNKIPKDEVYINLTELYSNGFGELQCQIVSEEKELIIPIIWNKILAKYFLYLYTIESHFYKDMNRILAYDEGFDIYREYITTLYKSLKNKTFESYTKTKLYRGNKIYEKDFEKLYKLFENKKEDENILFFTKSFLSFTKNETIADNFIKYEQYYVPCKYVIENYNSQFAYNIDVKDNTYYKTEEEILFLPMSCFFVVNIKKTENREKETVYNVYLKYIDEYSKKIEDKFKRINQNIKDHSDFENAFLTEFGKHLYKLYNNIIDDYTKYIKERFLLDIKPAIPDYKTKYTPQEKIVSIKFDTEQELKKFLEEEKHIIKKSKPITNIM